MKYLLAIYIFSLAVGFFLGGAAMIFFEGIYQKYQSTFWFALIIGLVMLICIVMAVYKLQFVWDFYIELKRIDKQRVRKARKKYTKRYGQKIGKEIANAYKMDIINRDFTPLERIIFSILDCMFELYNFLKNQIEILILDKVLYRVLVKIGRK